MSAVTTTPTGGAGKAADANNPNAAQNAAGDFTQLITELLGNNASTPTDAASAAVANATSSDADASSADKAAAKDDPALTPEMLALGYPIAYALTPQPPPAPAAATAQLTNTGTDDVATKGVAGNVGTANSDAAQLQQLTQLLAKRGDANADSATAIAAAKQQGKNDGKSDGNGGACVRRLIPPGRNPRETVA